MAIWNFNFNELEYQAMPYIYTFEQNVSWIKSICKPIEWLRDAFFTSFVKGSTASDYNSGTAYVFGDRVQYGEAIYVCYLANTGKTPNIEPDYWVIETSDRIGLQTRIKYNANKLVLEFALNQRFKTTFRQPNHLTTPTNSDIFVLNNTVFNGFNVGTTKGASVGLTKSSQGVPLTVQARLYDFAIYVPAAKYASLGSDAEMIIRFWVDKINIAGIKYIILTY